jgi:exopolysaccharide biosynthesis polyprenyl glycosylphosphotransferase
MSPEVNIHFSSGLFEILTTGVRVRERAYVPLISLNKVRLTGVDVLLKTTLDLAITIPGLIVIAPLLALIALLIKLDSPGPVFYRRRVFGLYGREFDAFKFRTMYADWQQRVDSDEVRKQFVVGVKPKNDPRVTRLGRFLRQYSLDELPQLINVLKRDMSLVGPRMITKEEAAFYEQWKMNLLTIRPGITGLWQVSGRADVTYEEKVRVDMYYIRNYTIWLDLQILFQTIPAVLKGKGAY